MRESVIYQDIFHEGQTQGLEQGLEQGSEQKAQEIAIKMINRGIDIQTIADVTGLTIEQVQLLQPRTLGN